MTILNLKEMVKIAEKVDEIKFTGFINEKELAEVGVGFMPIEGENNFENMLNGMVLKHIDSGISVKQIVSFVDDCIKNAKRVEEHHLKIEQEYSEQLFQGVKREKELKDRIEELEKELAELKGEVKPKKKRGRKPKAKVEEVSNEEKEIIDFTKRYNSPKVLVPIDDEDIPF